MSFSERGTATGWRFVHFGLIVTGKGEREFLPDFFRSIMATGKCSFRVISRISQRSPIQSNKRKLQMIGSGKMIPDKDVHDIGLPARGFLSSEDRFILLVDDLEPSRADDVEQVFGRYRSALDTLLSEEQIRRASVHFFVNMLEAYYFADARAVNDVLGTRLDDYEGDVELIQHPKNKLKGIHHGFRAREHGAQIVSRLDVPHVLSREETCSSLRTMFAWIYRAIGEAEGELPQALGGRYNEVTKPQVCVLPGPVPER